MHPSAYMFATHALDWADVKDRAVIEAGAMDVNGTARPAIEALGPASYVATDMRAGPGVDVVCAAEDLPARFGADSAGVVISTECLEHAKDWQAAMAGMITILKPGGVLLLTTRSEGFPPHGYPDDHWRFSVDAMRAILNAAGLTAARCEPDPDPASPGVFAKAYKPAGWAEPHGPALRTAWDAAGVTAMPA